MTKQLRPWRVSVPITKVDEAQRLALGWASSATMNHQPIVDHHEDVIDVAELEKAGYHYVENSRVAGEMHEKLGVGTLVESVILTSEKRRAMGLPDDGHSAWWVGFRVTDDATWAKVQKGQLKEFSIGGEAYRDPHPTIAGAYALNDLVIKEVSFVDVGAGVCVPVALTKARERAMKGLKAIIAKIADPKKRAEIEAKIEVAQKAKDVAKGEVLTLADVQEALTPELFAVVLQAIESSAMMSGGPPAPPPTEAPAEGGDGLELAKSLKDELAKAKKATELAEKQREEQREETRKMAVRLEAVEKERHFEKALSAVRKDLSGLPGDEKAHAEALMALDDIERFAKQGMPVVISADVAKHLRTTLEMSAVAIGQGEILKTFGGGRGPVSKDPRGELEKLAKGLMDKDAKLTEHQAMAKAYRDRPDLYQAMRAQAD